MSVRTRSNKYMYWCLCTCSRWVWVQRKRREHVWKAVLSIPTYRDQYIYIYVCTDASTCMSCRENQRTHLEGSFCPCQHARTCPDVHLYIYIYVYKEFFWSSILEYIDLQTSTRRQVGRLTYVYMYGICILYNEIYVQAGKGTFLHMNTEFLSTLTEIKTHVRRQSSGDALPKTWILIQMCKMYISAKNHRFANVRPTAATPLW